jgi:hypothetical protein
MMPTFKQIEMLTKMSFNPIFAYNPWLSKLTSVNSAQIKTINGRSIYFVGAQSESVGGSQTKDSANLRSIPCDRVDRDEIDLMEQSMIDQSEQRLNASNFRHINNFGSPTYPGYGIDQLYEDGDQTTWNIKCDSCNSYTCIETTFLNTSSKEIPKCFGFIDGHWVRVCVKCGKQIDQRKGEWVSAYPSRENGSWWVSNFLSPQSALDDHLKRYQSVTGGALCEFMRSIVGIASIEAEDGLTEQEVLSCCGTDGVRGYWDGETVMGVDDNKGLRVVIGRRIDKDVYEIYTVANLESLNQVHDLAAKMGVKYSVIDSGPFDHGIRDFQKKEPYKTWLCYYSEQMAGEPKWDNTLGTVKCNRNEWCDKVHSIVVDKKLILPRRSPAVNEYASEMTHTVKALIKNPDTGISKPRWIKRGRDDYFHATLYFLLAASRMTPIPRSGRSAPRVKFAINKFHL